MSKLIIIFNDKKKLFAVKFNSFVLFNFKMTYFNPIFVSAYLIIFLQLLEY